MVFMLHYLRHRLYVSDYVEGIGMRKSNVNDKIDIVVPWVDGNDRAWKLEKKKYDGLSTDSSCNSEQRFRDWDLMRYWFRGIEKNLPWVNKIYFVTWGHLPEWLNTDNEKLVVVNHKDYIPEEYLPTYNSNTIELNIHRIKDLSENFILFNDDLFVIDRLREDAFFKNNIPCDMLLAKTMVNYDRRACVWHIAFNDMGVVNKYCHGGSNALRHFGKWVNIKYGFRNSVENMLRMTGYRLSAFYDSHLPIAYKKSSFEKIWEREHDYLDEVCRNRFRTPLDLNQWLVRYTRFAEGSFVPSDVFRWGKYYEFSDEGSLETICGAIQSKERACLVLNDTLPGENAGDFERYKRMLERAFEKILPEQSSFESCAI